MSTRWRERSLLAPPSDPTTVVPAASAVRSLTGRGVEATVGGRQYTLGGPNLLRERQLSVPDELHGSVASWTGRGAAVLYLAEGSTIIGALSLEDEVRGDARGADDRRRAERAAAQAGRPRPLTTSVS